MKPVRFVATVTAIALLPAMIFLGGCVENSTSTERVSPTVTNASWLLDTEPADALSVSEAKASASEGQTVTMRARIGGRKEPMTAGSPVFTVVDLEIPHCGQIPGDTCGTPWDYCCEPRDSLTANAATIQLVDSDGEPIAGGAGPLRPLDEIVVIGSVGPRPDDQVLTIRATGVYRVVE